MLNTAFGYGLYYLFSHLGMNAFLAQAISYVLGVAFNYVTFRTLVFHGSTPKVHRFVGAYVFNYLISAAILSLYLLALPPSAPSPVCLLATGHGFPMVCKWVTNKDFAGFLTVITASVVNYFILKRFVFKAERAAT